MKVQVRPGAVEEMNIVNEQPVPGLLPGNAPHPFHLLAKPTGAAAPPQMEALPRHLTGPHGTIPCAQATAAGVAWKMWSGLIFFSRPDR